MSQTDRCGEFADDLALLALGTLAGRERASVIDHLESCPACSAELEGLSVAADALLLLAPEATPPAGFDQRAVAAMRQGRDHRRSRPRMLAAAAAIVAVLGLGVGLGAVVTRSGNPTPGMTTAALVSSTGAKGNVMLSWGPTAWMFMTIGDVPATGPVTCTITLADGTTRTVGHFRMTSGYGAWAVRLPTAAANVRGVAVLDGSGVTIASASI
jgi:hypothetical protein